MDGNSDLPIRLADRSSDSTAKTGTYRLDADGRVGKAWSESNFFDIIVNINNDV
jgi:hypothetical protein